MEIIHDTTKFYMQQQTAVAIGKFDGIHKAGNAGSGFYILSFCICLFWTRTAS